MLMCGVQNCKNRAQYAIRFEARAIGSLEKTSGDFNTPVCESHKNTLQPTDLINGTSWQAIQSALLSKGKALLDRASLKLKFFQIQ